MTLAGRLQDCGQGGGRRLDLRGCGLTRLPEQVLEFADTLEVLDLSGNALHDLPSGLARCGRLRVLFCSANRFASLPPVLGACAALEMVGFKSNVIETVPGDSLPRRLRWLILTDNRIAQLPAGLARCARLRKLMLAGNRLRELPAGLAGCAELELVRIAANDFESMPHELLHCPSLAWLAFGGNPLGRREEARALQFGEAMTVPWHALAFEAVLGEGASGVIHRAAWQADAAASRAVAVKIFKGAVTSDGWPRSEMAAWLAAGAAPGLIPVLGRLVDHPDGSEGLLMPLIDESLHTLADPPSFESCTRDVYAEDAAWPAAAALTAAASIGAAMQRLHARGVLHGDLYAHNILWDRKATAVLGDFGAGSLLPDGEAGHAATWRQLDVRCFGILLDELLARSSTDTAGGDAAMQTLVTWRDACLRPLGERPEFAELAPALCQAASSACEA